MNLRKHLTDIRDWLNTWSGRLATLAAAISPILTDNAMSSLGLAEYVPAGWPRYAFLALVVLSTFALPLAAQKKDQSNADEAK